MKTLFLMGRLFENDCFCYSYVYLADASWVYFKKTFDVFSIFKFLLQPMPCKKRYKHSLFMYREQLIIFRCQCINIYRGSKMPNQHILWFVRVVLNWSSFEKETRKEEIVIEICCILNNHVEEPVPPLSLQHTCTHNINDSYPLYRLNGSTLFQPCWVTCSPPPSPQHTCTHDINDSYPLCRLNCSTLFHLNCSNAL